LEETNISKADLAKKMGVTKGHISQTLKGSRNMTLRTLADICFALDCQPTLRLELKPNNLKPGNRENSANGLRIVSPPTPIAHLLESDNP
jgi:transcriptional regulator with XRE-family HTH domain